MASTSAIIPVGYKQTEIGVIPKDWGLEFLGRICIQITDGTHHTPNYTRKGIPFYSVENITKEDFEDCKYISAEDHLDLIKRCRPERGNLLMTRITAGVLGATKIIDWDINASIYVSLALLKINNKKVSNMYIYSYSKSRMFRDSLEKRALMNASPQKINLDSIKDIPIPIPSSRREQIAISDVLMLTEDYIKTLQNLIVKKMDIQFLAIWAAQGNTEKQFGPIISKLLRVVF